MNRGQGIVVAAVLLAGCVPGGTRVRDVKTATAPRIEPLMDGLIDEPPIWEARPVVANAQRDTDGRRRHRVVAGDTGIAIARAYAISWSAIVDANGLSEPFIIRVGQRLLLPGPITPDAEARAAAFKIDIDDIATGGMPAGTVEVPFPKASPSGFQGRFRWPLVGAVAERFGPVGKGRINRGIEIAGPSGSDIRAAADGTVAFVGNGGSAGYGGLILVRHSDGWISVYGRAAQAMVARGQSVKAGQTIGSIGDDTKLHFELRRNRIPVDPVKYLLLR